MTIREDFEGMASEFCKSDMPCEAVIPRQNSEVAVACHPMVESTPCSPDVGSVESSPDWGKMRNTERLAMGEDPEAHWDYLRDSLLTEYFNEDCLADDAWTCAQLQEAVFALHGLHAKERGQFLESNGEKAGTEFMAALDAICNDVEFPKAVVNEYETLRRDSNAIFDAIGRLYQKPLFGGSSSTQKLGFSKIKFGGVGPVREVLLVPKNMQVSTEHLAELIGKKQWKLHEPDTLVVFDAGTRHPSSFTTPALREHRAFTKLLQAAKLAANSELQLKGGDTTRSSNARIVEKHLNQLMLERTQEIYQEVLDASFMSSNWVFIDRRSATASSPAAELLLENVIDRLQKRPPVVVMDSITRYRDFKPSREVIKQLIVFGDILCESREAGDSKVKHVHQCYSASEFKSWEPYHFQNPSDHFTEDEEKRKEGDKRLPRAPEAGMIAADDDGRPMTTKDGRPLVTPEVKWVYHYRQYLFDNGSHYIIFEDASTNNFPLRVSGTRDWPQSRVFAHGGNLAFDRLQECLTTGMPMVLLQNTGGVTQLFSSLFFHCVTQKAKWMHLEKAAISAGRNFNLIEELMKNVKSDIVSVEPWTKLVGPSTVELMRRLEERAPEKLRNSVAVVDVLHASAEDVIEKVTSCFASGGVGLPELGVGSADEDIVARAWHSSLTFDSNAIRFRVWGDTIYYLSLVVSVTASVLALVAMDVDEVKGWHLVIPTSENYDEALRIDAEKVVNKTLIFLPVVATLLAAVASRRRHIQKWAMLHTASRSIVSEIYKFRARVGYYDELSGPVDEPDSGGDEEAGGGNAGGGNAGGSNARDRFAERYQDLYRFAISSIGEDSIRPLKRLGSSPPPVESVKERDHLWKAVRVFVEHRLWEGRGSEKRTSYLDPPVQTSCCRKCCPCRSRKRVTPAESLMDIVVPDPHRNAAEPQILTPPDTFRGPTTIEMYMEYRLKPALASTKMKVPILATRLARFDTLIILINAVGTGLVIVNNGELKVWVALTVTLATVVSNISQHQVLQPRLCSNNTAIQDLEGIQSYITSLSIVHRRMRVTRTSCVQTVEKAFIEPVVAWTGVSIPAPDLPSAKGSSEKKDQ